MKEDEKKLKEIFDLCKKSQIDFLLRKGSSKDDVKKSLCLSFRDVSDILHYVNVEDAKLSGVFLETPKEEILLKTEQLFALEKLFLELEKSNGFICNC